jgi:PKD repeat protein
MKSSVKWLWLFLFIIASSSGCKKNEPIPTASFSYQANNNLKIPCTVIFTNLSTDAFSYDWDFGDGGTSTEKNPTHIYTKPGDFTILLKSYTESRYEWASSHQVISIKDTVK